MKNSKLHLLKQAGCALLIAGALTVGLFIGGLMLVFIDKIPL